MQKIDQCNIIFDFNDPTADMKSKEIKRLALHELLDYVANNRSVITEPMYPRVVEMETTGIESSSRSASGRYRGSRRLLARSIRFHRIGPSAVRVRCHQGSRPWSW